jgi:phospholipase C
MANVSRRGFLSGSAAAAGGVVVGGLVPGATADAAPKAESGPRRHGTIKDVKHVVILMQENRSFDHYYGSLGGVRGFGDKRLLTFPDGSTVLSQPDATRTDGGTLFPWHMDTAKYDAQEAGDLDHSWEGTHEAWNGGAWNRWIAAKGEETMGFFTRSDIPWQYALADAFTICDSYHCSIQGPTTPNRLYHWTGMIDPAGKSGGPAISNPADYNPVYSWTTYPERLEKAGISWQVYANDEVGDGADGYVGDYGDNPLWLFQAYHDALASTDPKTRRLAERASLRTAWKPDSGKGHDVEHVLEQFITDAKAGDLPQVSWVVAPYAYCEHPQARPVDGANYTNRVLDAIWSNKELWESTVVLLNFDENDGFFDHIPAPFSPAGTAAEYVEGLPIGLGPRVPMTVVSPWSHGGWVNSQVFDHTSVIRFLEVFTGVHEPNISEWRRTVCGDLTSCFDFTNFDAKVPKLPSTASLVRIADEEKSLPQAAPPATGAQHKPKPEFASRHQRALPYQVTANLTIKKNAPTITVHNDGREAVSLLSYDRTAVVFSATPLLVRKESSAAQALVALAGRYDVEVHGPNGFLRSFAGTTTSGLQVGAHSHATKHGRVLELVLTNDGTKAVVFALKAVDFGTKHEKITVRPGHSERIEWPSEHGWYDVSVTSGTALVYRFAGKIEAH